MSKRFMPTSPRCSMQALLIALKGRHCLSVRGGQGRVLAASCLKADAMPTQAVKKSIKTKSTPTTWRSNFEPRKKWSRICMPGLNMRQTTQPELPEPWTILRGANAAAFKPAHHLYAEFVCRILAPPCAGRSRATRLARSASSGAAKSELARERPSSNAGFDFDALHLTKISPQPR